MSAPLESFLARLLVDVDARARFLRDPRKEATAAGLSPTEIEAMAKMDRAGLEMAAVSLVRKKTKRSSR